MKIGNKPPTVNPPKDTTAAIGDIFYEFTELYLLYTDYCRGSRERPWPSLTLKNPELQSLVYNAALEKMLIHTRNLFDFFKDRRSYDDDIWCEDYGYKAPKLAIEPSKLKILREDINKTVMHLSYVRVGQKIGWNPTDFAPVILIETGHFFDALSQTNSPVLLSLNRDDLDRFMLRIKGFEQSWNSGERNPINPDWPLSSSTTGL